jgi:hypothetical protein
VLAISAGRRPAATRARSSAESGRRRCGSCSLPPPWALRCASDCKVESGCWTGVSDRRILRCADADAERALGVAMRCCWAAIVGMQCGRGVRMRGDPGPRENHGATRSTPHRAQWLWCRCSRASAVADGGQRPGLGGLVGGGGGVAGGAAGPLHRAGGNEGRAGGAEDAWWSATAAPRGAAATNAPPAAYRCAAPTQQTE